MYDGDGVAWTGGSTESGMGSLHDPRARAPHTPIQATHSLKILTQ